MVAVQVRVVAGAPDLPQRAALALDGHLHLFREPFANQHRSVCQPFLAREARLALGGVSPVAAVVQRQPRAVLYLGQVHVVLLQLLQRLHVFFQEQPSPGRPVHLLGVGALVPGPTQRQGRGHELRPLLLRLLALLLPLLRVVVDGSADVCRVAAVLLEEGHLALLAQLLQLGERRELVVALHEELARGERGFSCGVGAWGLVAVVPTNIYKYIYIYTHISIKINK